MAQMLVCDLDNQAAETTVRIKINDREIEIDLCEEHDGELADQFAEWAEFGRRPGKPPKTITKHTKPAVAYTGIPWWSNLKGDTPQETEMKKQWRLDMRKWGWANGWELGTLGRIPADLAEAYVEAKGLKIDHQRHRVADPDDEAAEDTEDSDEDGEPAEQPSLLPEPTSATRSPKRKPPPKTSQTAARLSVAK